MTSGIRLATAADAAQIAAIYAPYCTQSSVSFEVAAPAADVIAQRIAIVTQRYPWLVLDDDGTLAGYVYASQYRERAAYQWGVEVTAYVADAYQRRGVGRALYTALFAVLALQGLHKAYGIITLPNAGSIGLHTAMGFMPVGVYQNVGYKLGAWHDVAWYELTLQPPQGEPQPPRPLDKVAGSAAWNEALAQGLALFRSA